jgi:hypothetical protein
MSPPRDRPPPPPHMSDRRFSREREDEGYEYRRDSGGYGRYAVCVEAVCAHVANFMRILHAGVSTACRHRVEFVLTT